MCPASFCTDECVPPSSKTHANGFWCDKHSKVRRFLPTCLCAFHFAHCVSGGLCGLAVQFVRLSAQPAKLDLCMPVPADETDEDEDEEDVEGEGDGGGAATDIELAIDARKFFEELFSPPAYYLRGVLPLDGRFFRLPKQYVTSPYRIAPRWHTQTRCVSCTAFRVT